MVVRLCAAQKFNQVNFWPLQAVGYWCRQMLISCYSSFLCMLPKKKKNVIQSLNSVWQWSLEGKLVSLDNLNTKTLLMIEFHR